MPTDIALASTNEIERRESMAVCKRAFERLLPLNPFAWVVHLSDLDTPHGHQNGSLESAQRSIDELCTLVSPTTIAIETLTDDLSYQEEIIKSSGLSVCLDVGHLALGGYDLDRVWEKWHDHILVVHMHGIDKGKDHKDLRFLTNKTIDSILTRTPHNRVTTIEVFGEEKLVESLKVVSCLTKVV